MGYGIFILYLRERAREFNVVFFSTKKCAFYF